MPLPIGELVLVGLLFIPFVSVNFALYHECEVVAWVVESTFNISYNFQDLVWTNVSFIGVDFLHMD